MALPAFGADTDVRTVIAGEGVEEDDAADGMVLLALDVLVFTTNTRQQFDTAILIAVRADTIISAQLQAPTLRIPQSILDSVKEEP